MNVDDITVLDPVYSTWIERKNFSCQDSPTHVLEYTVQYNTIQYNTIQYKYNTKGYQTPYLLL